MSVRNILVGLALAFTAYLAARGLWWTEPVPLPGLLVVALFVYLGTTWIVVLWEPHRGARAGTEPIPEVDGDGVDTALDAARSTGRLPGWAAGLALGAAIVVPNALSLAVGIDHVTAPYATWYLGGIGALMVVVMVRRRPWIAWLGIVALGVTASVWMGPLTALGLGLVGSLVWVAVAQMLMLSLDRAARDTAQLTKLQRQASGVEASQSVRQRERRTKVQRALAIAGPVLMRVVAERGRLTEDERLGARIAEGSLRDELRGPRLLDDAVRAELERLRRRGASVTVLDEGGLDRVDDVTLSIIRGQLAETLSQATSERLYVRTSPHESVAVTVVGRSGSGAGLSDEDAVDLWREIAHPRR